MIKIQKILCPVDFSDCSEHALQYAVAFAQAHQAELHVLHVMEPAAYGAEMEGLSAGVLKEITESAAARLNELTERVRKQCPTVAQHSATGAAFVEIIKQAREQDVDLIVMGTHGRTGLAHVLIGSCAERVVRKAPCPVLTVKHPEHEFVLP
jgi:universal stress protein A